jgi:AcrR family transcriptional regulator
MTADYMFGKAPPNSRSQGDESVARRSSKTAVRQPVQRRSAATVETILEAAAQIFRAHGAKGATTNRIAERAGVSVGSIYQYFPNKESLLVALMEKHIDESVTMLSSVMEATAAATPSARVGALVKATLDLHVTDPELHRIIFEDCPRPPHVRATLERVERRTRTALEAMLRDFPRSVCADPTRSAYVATTLVESMVHRYVTASERPMEPQAFADHLTALVMREMALSSPPSAGSER